MKVSVCVASYQRPDGLARCLDYLNRLTFDRIDPPELEIVVVDNDPEGTAAATCETARPGLRWLLRYEHEPRRGISYARNRAVEAVRDRSDFLAFVDDDEMPEPIWLEELLRVQAEYDADVVSGPVEPRFEGDVPEWIVKGGFFDSVRYPTGHAVSESGTGNVLIRTRLLREMDRIFDERLALTGGEDVEFFWRVSRAGYRMVWADEAMVYEAVPPSRTNAAWVLRRAYRIGISVGAHGGDPATPTQPRVMQVAKALVRVAQYTLLLPVSALAGRPAAVRRLQSISYRFGELAGMFGFRYEEYRVTHGR